MSAQIPGATGDPLPAPAITENTWSSIGAGHRLIYLDEDWVLDWVPMNGDFRVFRIERNPAAGADPLPSPAICFGNWASIRAGHDLVYLGSNRLLDWELSSGKFRVWLINRGATGNTDPILGVPQTVGSWSSIDSGHQLISLDDGRVLDWKSSTGDYRIWRHDALAVGAADPLAAPPLAQGVWSSIRGDRRLFPMGSHRVLDWKPTTGEFRVWIDVPGAAGDPFPGEPEILGQWTTIRSGHELLYVGGDRVLAWETANGHFRLYRYDRDVTTLRRATIRVHLRVLTEPVVKLDAMVASARVLYGAYGIDFIESSRKKIDVDGTPNAYLQEPFVGKCNHADGPTDAQVELFSLRDGIGPNELVVYFVRNTSPSFGGCAKYPPDRPGALITRSANEWTLSHEVAHVLGLEHVIPPVQDRLMNKTASLIKNPPPDLISAEIQALLASPFAQK